MAAPLSLASAVVAGPDGAIHSDTSVLVRGDLLTMRQPGGATEQRTGLQTVQQTSRGVWTLRFADGTELTVTRNGKSCCGGRAR